MPELPEVEVVRRGLQGHVVGHRLDEVTLSGIRVARRHLPGPQDLTDRLRGTTALSARRRGKYLWLVLSSDEALVLHLGMSGQLLVEPNDAPLEKHCHAVFDLGADPLSQDHGVRRQLRFVDQRTFGGLQLTDLVPDRFAPGEVPAVVAHIAPDPLEAAFDQAGVVRAMRRRHTQIKRALLDQSLVSGIGNIYADEALWRARVHGERATDKLPSRTLREVLDHAHEVMVEALDQGGTSFDALYVNVNGASGYFERSLNAYGRQGLPCRRCGTLMRREAFMNRSSFSCPTCQRRPRRASGG
ncbi:bifunctional DNA-formamidopyrimidine glycosylase/DNA-(apurinic or apyrimidinic site) lyase [Leekyejoonella antrihumi]|uniref:Formamidopyrimidine-DNA glycosylase n=1 Tax=Leekyejoonella antrihumi TaxID=1660198 RepID=A0A563DRZ7_9MICO|nr:bifunctional DNA-formamidopyrimidine glycosylase/DNA-(apurinic or apyrimidinic site) lyase [Leekyejoonella antrihumi]TWP33020.1 bifunctional DNA-formamidopyrimidine glycosylase/DNA-(apurinic or apyrimidinic site) lyase [Leekyejoonella antrihumi]